MSAQFPYSSPDVTRRGWLVQTARAVVASGTVAAVTPWSRRSHGSSSWFALESNHPSLHAEMAARVAAQAVRLEPGPWQALAQQAVEAARTAGASYADARLTRIVEHCYMLAGPGTLWREIERVGVGVRVLVNGYWGFAANPFWTADDVVQLARDAVAQAKVNAIGMSRAVDLAPVPVVTGAWETPIRIDPFHITIEEKQDHFVYWKDVAQKANMPFYQDGAPSECRFGREERVVATSDGSLFTQTLYDSGGMVVVEDPVLEGEFARLGHDITTTAHRLDRARIGWELLLDAKLDDPDTYTHLHAELEEQYHRGAKPTTIGRYTLVCDGATMGTLVGQTLGVATQLDRTLGYEANASGTSFIDDPLAMVGNLQVTSPLVTVTANRSAPTQFATVKWDDEGVVPPEVTLIKAGVLTDFQTTREQAAWLAPYYQRRGRLVHSNGCAAATDGLSMTMQHMPNLKLEPSPSNIRLEDLVADVKDGIFIERGFVWQIDAQARNGILGGAMREIKDGRLGRTLEGCSVMFNSKDIWQHLTAIGGPTTSMVAVDNINFTAGLVESKGQPPQETVYSTQAVAAILPNQPLIDMRRKA